jgi:signal transduction histidine kinase
LQEHIPLLLEQVAHAVADEATPGVEAEARDHGSQRWDHGFVVEEVIWELSALRLLLLEEVEQYAQAHPELPSALVVEASRRLVAVIDLTARASAAQFVEDAKAQLGAANGQLTVANEQLQVANERLQAMNAEKDRFLAMLAHELRNPLTPILNAVHLLKTQAPSDPGLARARAIIERQTHHLARLVHDLVDVARVTQGKIDLRPEIVDFRACVQEVVEHAQSEAETKGLTLRVDASGEPLPVRADPDRLQQVITNLLNNALRYTPAPGDITLTLRREEQEVVLRVRDTGIGIAAELLPRIFDLFTQADRSLDRARAGLGIGLSLAQHLNSPAVIMLLTGSVEELSG